MYRTKEQQLRHDLEEYSTALWINFRNYLEDFYEQLARAILGKFVDGLSLYELSDKNHFIDNENEDLVFELSFHIKSYLTKSIRVNNREIYPDRVLKIWKLTRSENRPPHYAAGFWIINNNKSMREVFQKTERYMKKLPGYRKPERPENVDEYLRGKINLHFERGK